MTIGRETFKVPEPVPRAGHPEPDRDRGHLRRCPRRRSTGSCSRSSSATRAPTEEFVIVERMTGLLPTVQQVLSTDEPARDAAGRRRVYVDPALYEYAVRLATATRAPEAHGLGELERYITFGASPRASINLILTARALAFVRGRDYALPEDVARHGPRRHAPPPGAVVRGALRRRHQRRAADHHPRPDPRPVVPLREHGNVRVSA